MRRITLGLVLLSTFSCVLPRPIEPAPRRPARTPAEASSAEPREARPAPVEWRTFGFSAESRPLRVCEVGHGPRRVLWVGVIHGDEREGAIATAELPATFYAEPGMAAAVTLTIVEDVNPDGSAMNRRGNVHGVDLNRNFPAGNFAPSARTGQQPLDQPEARALHDLILRLRPDLIIVSHSARRGRFINWDGPAEHLARRFAHESGFPLVESDDLHATPGSLGSWAGRDQAFPILTLEYARGEDPYAAWEDSRRAILAVIAAE